MRRQSHTPSRRQPHTPWFPPRRHRRARTGCRRVRAARRRAPPPRRSHAGCSAAAPCPGRPALPRPPTARATGARPPATGARPPAARSHPPPHCRPAPHLHRRRRAGAGWADGAGWAGGGAAGGAGCWRGGGRRSAAAGRAPRRPHGWRRST
eukprot:6336255-Prymnesium_polylepis.2